MGSDTTGARQWVMHNISDTLFFFFPAMREWKIVGEVPSFPKRYKGTLLRSNSPLSEEVHIFDELNSSGKKSKEAGFIRIPLLPQ
jgi:hypothetical protein